MAIAVERGKRIFRKAERELARLSSDLRPESVHAFRTTARRVQTLLQDVLAETGRDQKKLLKLLGRVRKRAGRIRDLDIQLSALRSLKVPMEPRRKTQLTQRLVELRLKQERRLVKLLKKKTIREIGKRLRQVSRELKFDSAGDPLAIARQLLGTSLGATAKVDEDLLHDCRLIVKRARYAAEFAEESADSSQLIANLKRLQDALGSWHDWFALTETATRYLGEIHQSPLVALLRNVTRGKFRSAVLALSASRLTAPLPGRIPAPAGLTALAKPDLKRAEAAA